MQSLRGLLTHRGPLLILFASSGMGIIWLLIEIKRKTKIESESWFQEDGAAERSAFACAIY